MIISKILIEVKNYIYLLKNISNRLTVEFVNQLSVIITLPFIANSLGINKFAIVSEGMIIIHLILLISSWGIDGYSIETINTLKKTSENTSENNRFITSFYINRFILISILLIILFYFLKVNLFNIGLKYYGLILFAIFSSFFLPLWFFQAIGKSEKLLIPTIIGRAIFVVLIFIFAKGENSIMWFFLSHGISSMIISLLGMIILFRMKYRIKISNIKKLFIFFKKSFSHFFFSVVNNQFNTLWAIAIIMLGSPTNIAIFNLANQVLKAGMGITELIGRVIRQSTFTKGGFHLWKILNCVFLIYLFIALISIFLTKDILSFFLINVYLDYKIVFQMMILVWFLNAIFKILSYAFLTKYLNIEIANQISIKAGLVHIGSIFFWLVFTIEYTASSIVLFMLISCLLQIIVLLIYIKLNKHKFIIK